MDPSNNNWTAAENKAFEVALAEVDLNSSDSFEQLMTRFPNKTLQQLRDHYMDLVVDIECNESGHFPNSIYSDPWAVSMATEMEGLSTLQVPYSPQFSGIELMSSRIGSVSTPEKKAEEESLLLLADKGENEVSLLEELMKDGFFEPMDEWRMKESSHEQVVGQERPVPEVDVLKILSPGIAEGGNNGLTSETKEKAMMSSEVVVEVQSGKQVLEEVSGVAVERKVVEKPETLASRKGKLWTKEEHRLFLTGLNIYGRGAWKKIAKNIVHTRTQTQVASHAQKYFERQSNARPNRRRSILDITTIPGIKIHHQTSMYNSVDRNSQTRVNNVNQHNPSSIPLQPPPTANYTPIVNYPQFSLLSLPDNLERNNNELGFKQLRSPNQTNSVQHRMDTDAMKPTQ